MMRAHHISAAIQTADTTQKSHYPPGNLQALATSHPKFSGGITTLTVRNTTFVQQKVKRATSKTILFLGHNHLLTTSTDDPVSLALGQ